MLTQHDAPITHDTLKSILRTLGSSGLKGEHHSFVKFASLRQVQRRMKTLEHIMIDHHFLVEYAVKEVIIEVIRCQLEEARLKMNIENSQVQEFLSRDQALNDIRCDTQSHSPHLIGWSFLYHLYVRADLNISLSEFAENSHVDVRTLRRYKNQVIGSLLKHIIRLEVECLESHSKQSSSQQ